MAIQDEDPPAPPAAEAEIPDREEPARARLDAAARRHLGRSLRLFYASVLDQPLPERLTRLLDDLSDTSSTRRGA